MHLNFSNFSFSPGTSRRSSLMSPPSFLSSRSSLPAETLEELALVLPSTNTPSVRDLGIGRLGFAGDTSSALKTGSRAGRVSVFEDTGIIEDPGFEIDPEGNFVELLPAGQRESVAPSAPGPASRLGSDSAISARVHQEHEIGLQGAQVRRKSPFRHAQIDVGHSSTKTSPSTTASLHSAMTTYYYRTLYHSYPSVVFQLRFPTNPIAPPPPIPPKKKHLHQLKRRTVNAKFEHPKSWMRMLTQSCKTETSHNGTQTTSPTWLKRHVSSKATRLLQWQRRMQHSGKKADFDTTDAKFNKCAKHLPTGNFICSAAHGTFDQQAIIMGLWRFGYLCILSSSAWVDTYCDLSAGKT